MSKRKKKGRIKESFALRFYSEVLGLEHLNYGLWDGEPLTLEGLRSAQERYSQRLISLIPDGVRSILDVGAGLGTLSLALRNQGYEVEGLSPDPRHQKHYRERVGRPFHLARFQDFDPRRTWDAIVMSEASQYIPLEKLFPSVQRAAPGGHLILSDYFRVRQEKGELPRGSGHDLEAFRDQARQAGFRLLAEEDITDSALRTLELGQKLYGDHLHPTLLLIRDSLTTRYPRAFGLARRIWGRKAAEKLVELCDHLDTERFRTTYRYLICHFALTARV